MAGFLSGLGYEPIPVTIDSEDWDHNVEYTRAVKREDDELAAEIARRYVDTVARNAAEGRAQAHVKLGRSAAHVLLLHMNLLNADALDALLTTLADDGFRFAGPEEVLSDPIYSLPDDYFGPQGLTWLDRIQR